MFCVTRGPPSIAAQFLRMHHENRHRQGSVAHLQSASCLCCPALLRISALHRHAASDPGTLLAFRPGKGPAGCHDSALWHGRDSRAGIAQLSRFLLQRMTSSAFLDFWMTDRGKCTLSGPLIIARTDFSLNFRVAGPSKCQISEP